MGSDDLSIAWCITGGGAGIRCVAEIVKKLSSGRARVTLFLSRWGYEVSRIFGVLDVLKSAADGGYYREFLVGDEGMFYLGRLNLGRYRLLVVAPATANTVAKMVLGIADSVCSALYSQAMKSRVPVVVMPTDIPGEDGFAETEIPCYIDKNVCSISRCGRCLAAEVCPANAIVAVDGFLRIDLARCIGCERCVRVCPYGAVRCWERIRVRPRDIDVENVEKLGKIPNTFVVRSCSELEETVKRILGL